MGILEIQRKLLKAKIKIFTVNEFRYLTGLSKVAAQRTLERYTQKGLFTRLRKGLYSFTLLPPSVFAIANKLIRPSYISYESALSFYGIIPEVVYSITSATTKKPKKIECNDKVFVYHLVKKCAFTGYTPKQIDDETVYIATPEKALCDYLYLVFLGKKSINDRINYGKIFFKKLLLWAKVFESKKFLNWIKICYQEKQ